MGLPELPSSVTTQCRTVLSTGAERAEERVVGQTNGSSSSSS
eukprot:CAMPEP_0118967352 /NCGR_PEP_ID=MMETSP1173-20130426/4752_1 /TAXON_ID=1034831 /ORGANISM="Rhizochromulina marina cf, Strain CCMP1243" /LENGTH=41 /DNA_ID= /DNA_START= /DNA_END= /DNA_ORIENTATION=